jgi:hypothetical protein
MMFKHIVEQMREAIGSMIAHSAKDDAARHSPAKIARLRNQAKRYGLPKMAGGKKVKYYGVDKIDPGLVAARVKDAGRRLR